MGKIQTALNLLKNDPQRFKKSLSDNFAKS